ncbi:unnamed protein product [Rotaria sp. Silwood2]|nr:unnamed protein product [Rotaria sp. Silwood2]CAF4010788.1 unnamed protein product [Rotaria sp. Silwood2]
MTTKNLSTSFKGKINGQRLPPIPITNEQPTTTTTVTNGDLPTSILKKSKPLTADVTTDDRILPLDDDDLETSRVIFQKSQADVLMLLDTYPPKTWTVPKCLKSSYEHILDQGRKSNLVFDAPLSSDNQHDDPVHAFPSPISDRISSSRYCRRSVSSACSRRSSILFQRHTGIPVDSVQLRREDTFDTVCESLTGSIRQSYTPLPPISIDPPSNLTKSLTIPSTNPPPSISPPLITAEETSAIQEEKKEFTRRLLSKSLHRELNILPSDKTMHSPTAIQKTPIVKPIVAPRLQKPIVDNRRVHSVDRQNPTVPIRNKIPTTTNNNIATNTNNQRVGKFSLDIFQPQSKSNITTNKKPSIINNKTKISTKTNVPKVKINPTISDEEIIQSNNDVIPSFPTAASIETTQITNTVKTEELPFANVNVEPVSQQTEQLKLDIPTEPKRHLSPRSNSNYSRQCSNPVPKPLSLEGEKTVDADYPQTITRAVTSTIINCQRRGSLKGQPLITDLFEESIIETQKSIVKPEPIHQTKLLAAKMKKQRRNFIKSPKLKKTIITNKPKILVKVIEKTEMKCQSTNTEINQEEKTNENAIIIGGTDWVMTVKPQVINQEESVLSQLFQIPTVDDEDIPSCPSPTDHLDVSQTTVMTSFDDIPIFVLLSYKDAKEGFVPFGYLE